MSWKTQGVFAVAVAGGAVAARRVAARRHPARTRWHAVTVFRPPGEVAADGSPPRPLLDLADRAEIAIRRAPGDRGTEIAARPLSPRDTPAVRRALREARSLLEAGEVLYPDRPPTTRRTLVNSALGYVTKRGREGGLL